MKYLDILWNFKVMVVCFYEWDYYLVLGEIDWELYGIVVFVLGEFKYLGG